MILYHGSYLEIAEPDLTHSRPNVDFGRGFYVTPLYEQAAKWCGKFKRRGGKDTTDRICKSVSAQRKHWGFCALKGVNRYECKPDFASKKI